MVFDVDKLKEALADAEVYGSEQWQYDIDAILAAARLVVAGQPLPRCKTHDADMVWLSNDNTGSCWQDQRQRGSFVKDTQWQPCEPVEGWWMPTGGGE